MNFKVGTHCLNFIFKNCQHPEKDRIISDPPEKIFIDWGHELDWLQCSLMKGAYNDYCDIGYPQELNNLNEAICLLCCYAHNLDYHKLTFKDFPLYIKEYLKRGGFNPNFSPPYRKYCYLELYKLEGSNTMAFYVGKGTKDRVNVISASSEFYDLNERTRIDLFCIPVLSLIDFPEIDLYYEYFLYKAVEDLFKNLKILYSDINFTVGLNSLDNQCLHRKGSNLKSYDKFLVCANKKSVERWIEDDESLTRSILFPIHRKNFLKEFNRISEKIKEVLLEFFVDKGQKVI